MIYGTTTSLWCINAFLMYGSTISPSSVVVPTLFWCMVAPPPCPGLVSTYVPPAWFAWQEGRNTCNTHCTLYSALRRAKRSTPCNTLFGVLHCIAGVIGWMGGGRIRAIMTFPLKYEESEPTTCGPAAAGAGTRGMYLSYEPAELVPVSRKQTHGHMLADTMFQHTDTCSKKCIAQWPSQVPISFVKPKLVCNMPSIGTLTVAFDPGPW